MIVIAAARVTSLPPSAYVAMFYRVGISLYYVSFFQGRQQTTLHLPKIGDVVRKSILLRLKVRPRCDNIHVLRCQALSLCQEIGIETKLEHGSRFRFTRELCVDIETAEQAGTPTCRLFAGPVWRPPRIHCSCSVL